MLLGASAGLSTGFSTPDVHFPIPNLRLPSPPSAVASTGNGDDQQQAVTFLFDVSLGRDVFKRMIQPNGTIANIIEGMIGSETNRQMIDAKDSKLRVSVIITASMPTSSVIPFAASFLSDDLARTSTSVLYQRYFTPHLTFLAGLPLLSTFFPVISEENLQTVGMKDPTGCGYDSQWIHDFGIEADDHQTPSVSDSALEHEQLLQLTEGLVAALEMFDTHTRSPFKTNVPSSLSATSSKRLRTRSTVPSIRRSLFVVTGKDPVSHRDRTQNTMTEKLTKDQKYQIQPPATVRGLGLVTPSLSPEDAQRQDLALSSNAPWQLPYDSNLETPMPTDTETATPCQSTSTFKQADTVTVFSMTGNLDRNFDHVDCLDLADQFAKREVAVALILTERDSASDLGLVEQLIQGARDRLIQSKAVERKAAWWTQGMGYHVSLGGFASPEVVVDVPAAISTSIIENDRNENGKRPISSAASPLEQDLASEAKRFKADAAAIQNSYLMAKSNVYHQQISRQFTEDNKAAILGGNTSVATAAGLGLNGTCTPAQIAAIQQVRAQQALQNKRNDAHKRDGVPLTLPTSSIHGAPMSIQELQQAAMTTQNLNAGQTSTLSAHTEILQMQALQQEVLRQQQAVKAATAATNGIAMSAQGNTSAMDNTTITAPQGPQRETAIWKGKLLASSNIEKPELNAPSVIVLTMRGSDPETYMPKLWPAPGSALALSSVRKLDMSAIQSLASKRQCPFVEFRAWVDSPPGDPEAQQSNNRNVSTFAAKLANGNLMFIYQFGPIIGGGLAVVPHRSSQGTYRLLGACFFTQPIPADFGSTIGTINQAPMAALNQNSHQMQSSDIQPPSATILSQQLQQSSMRNTLPDQTLSTRAPAQVSPDNSLRGVGNGTVPGAIPAAMLSSVRAALKQHMPNMDVNSLPPDKLARLLAQLQAMKTRQDQQRAALAAGNTNTNVPQQPPSAVPIHQAAMQAAMQRMMQQNANQQQQPQ